MENHKRNTVYKKNDGLEKLLIEMDGLIDPIERKLVADFEQPELPIVFIVGCARCGSTLLLQFLSQCGLFAFPTNLLSRFYFAPFFGSKVQQLLVDYDFKGEIFDQDIGGTFNSDLGKTKGAKAPHEFWYFWRRFFKFGELQQLDKEAIKNIDQEYFVKELSALQSVYGLPLLMKAMNLNWHIPLLNSYLKNAFFIHIKKDTQYNAQSLILARERFFQNPDEWYSFKTADYHEIMKGEVEEQVVRQVTSTNKAIEEGLKAIPSNKYLSTSYDDFCKNPNLFLTKIADSLNIDTNHLNLQKDLKFESQNRRRISDESWDKITHYKTIWE